MSDAMLPDLPSRYLIGMLIGLLFIAMTGCISIAAQTTTSPSEFENKFVALISQPRYDHASWGFIVVDPETGEPLFAKNADEMFTPASTTKLFSSSAVFDALGPDYRIKTPVYAVGTIDPAGTLDGNFVLVASGDPTMGWRTLPDGTIEFTNIDHSE